MKITCIANSGKSLSPKQIALGNSIDYKREYLELNKIYTVYGILIIKDTLNFLIVRGLEDSPTIEPAELFDVTEHNIPPTWQFNAFRGSVVEAVIGYEELALDKEHNVELVNRNTDAFKKFYIRKNEIDEWEKGR